MLPFSKRPPPPEEYFLRSGDFEAVQANDPYAIPPAPRSPVFARQAAPSSSPAPYGFVPGRYTDYPKYGDLSAPPPPHSLAPVAMGSERNAVATGTNRSIAPVVVREKPSLKWGVMIAVTGALLGGVLGLGMDARRQSQRAAAMAEASQNQPAMTAAVPQGLPPMAANALLAPAPSAAAPAIVAPVVIPPQAPIAVTATKQGEPVASKEKAEKADKPEKAEKHAKAFRGFHGGGGSIAVKVNKPVEKAEPAAAPEPKVAKAEKAEKAEAAPKAAPKKDASTSAAQQLLEAANKDTANTL